MADDPVTDAMLEAGLDAFAGFDPNYWFDTYVWTYDPRLVGKPGRRVRPVQALAEAAASSSSG
jgi:hypothetical protein